MPPDTRFDLRRGCSWQCLDIAALCDPGVFEAGARLSRFLARNRLAIHFAGNRGQAYLVAMIVHARKPNRREKTQARATPPIATIATAKKPTDPEAEARAKAWLKKQLRSPGA